MRINIAGIPEPEKIRNLIFDFGGVICDLDMNRTAEQFKKLGISSFYSDYSVTEREDIYRRLERGVLSPEEFREILKKSFATTVSDKEIDDAWNAMLLEIPEPRIRLLEKLSKDYRTFILSNSNEIHFLKYTADLRSKYGYSDLDELVEKAYFSFRIHQQKPSREIFDYVINERRLIPEETLFIDDSVQHTEGARNAGLLAYHLKLDRDEQVTDLFTE